MIQSELIWEFQQEKFNNRVGGVPAKVIRYRFSPEVIAKLLELEWWNFDESKLKNSITIFQKDILCVDDIEKFIEQTR